MPSRLESLPENQGLLHLGSEWLYQPRNQDLQDLVLLVTDQGSSVPYCGTSSEDLEDPKRIKDQEDPGRIGIKRMIQQGGGERIRSY